MDGVMEDVKCLFGQVLNKVTEDIRRELQDLSDEQMSIIESRLDVNPFEGLETHYFQDKYFKEHLDYLVSIKIKVVCVFLMFMYVLERKALYLFPWYQGYVNVPLLL